MTRHLEVRSGEYHDSVTLMRVSRSVSDGDGVEAALVAMATELNLDLLQDMGFETPKEAGPNDLVVALRASDDETLEEAREAVEASLAESGGGGGSDLSGAGETPPARTTASAAARAGRPGVALISTPGPNAFVEALDALQAGLSVMVFSDNVPLEQELALKEEAAQRELLAMGPDCGTAIVSGVGLGFANAVRPGPVGVVAASGTGAQQVACLLDEAGVGLTQLLGVGGRDLSADVGGAATLQALRALDEDPATELILVVSKPPDAEIAEQVRTAAGECSKPVVLGFVGRGERDLTAVVGEVLQTLDEQASPARSWGPEPPDQARSGELRGLFSGGTLCDEAMAIAAETLGQIRSNIPLESDWDLDGDLHADGHVAIDFGDDALTQGRPHPMIDNGLRIEQIGHEATRSGENVLLLDVVLGHGAHPDPADELVPALRQARDTASENGRDLAVVISLCGSQGDPQDRDRQAEAFAELGAAVFLSNADAARAAVALLEGAVDDR